MPDPRPHWSADREAVRCSALAFLCAVQVAPPHSYDVALARRQKIARALNMATATDPVVLATELEHAINIGLFPSRPDCDLLRVDLDPSGDDDIYLAPAPADVDCD